MKIDVNDPIVGQYALGLRTFHGQPAYDLFQQEVKKAKRDGGKIDLCDARDAVLKELRRNSVAVAYSGE